MVDEQEDAEVVQSLSAHDAVERAAEEGEPTIIKSDRGVQVAILPASSPWVNGLRTALREQQEGDR